MRLKRIYKRFPSYNIKIILGDMNAKFGKAIWTINSVGGWKSQVPTVSALMAVPIVLSLGLTYSK